MKFLFAGGGSGGTIGPGIAIAERIAELAPDSTVMFLASDRAIDRTLLREGQWAFAPTPAAPPVRSPQGAWRFVRGWRGTRRVASTHVEACTHVVALGGFVAPPVVAEAVARGVPVTLVNLDAVAGRANRWISKRATTTLTAVPCDLPGAEGPVGVPLRRAVLAQGTSEEARVHLGLDPEQPVLLVTGASQGAQSINQFMLAFLRDHAAALAGWQVLHLAGTDGPIEALRRAYAAHGIPAVVEPFLAAMGDAWGAAEFALSRGGASSIAEIEANRVPSIIAPYPWHKDNHQARNAQPLVDLGGAEVVQDAIDPAANLRTIGKALRSVLEDPAGRAAMRAAIRGSEHPDAARAIAERLLELKALA